MSSRTVGQIQSNIKQTIPKNSKLLLAVSGGVDSMVMLDLIHNLKSELKLELAVAHVDHNLRASSSEDLKFVKSSAEKYAVKFYSYICENPPSNNIEAWGREQRYSFFTQILKEDHYDYCLTAHTASDQVETLLMKLCSNRELILIQKQDLKRKLLRPLLNFTKQELVEYAESNQISFVEDATNSSDDFLRNRVRNRLIPVLQEVFDESVVHSLSEQAERINSDTMALNQVAGEHVARLKEVEIESEEFYQEVANLIKNAPEGIAWRLIEEVFLPYLDFKMGKASALRVLEVINKQALAAEIPGGLKISRSNGRLALHKS